MIHRRQGPSLFCLQSNTITLRVARQEIPVLPISVLGNRGCYLLELEQQCGVGSRTTTADAWKSGAVLKVVWETHLQPVWLKAF